MLDSQIIDAIVPIYCDGEFNGTGFIYKSFLITAAHVVENMNDIYYKFQGNHYKLQEENRIYCKQYGKDRDIYGRVIFNALAEDLAIYIIDTPCCELDILDKILPDDTNALLFGYHYINEKNIPLKKGAVKIYNSCNVDGAILFPQEYCMYCKKIDSTDNFIKGYSGGPLLDGNTVVGMLIESMTIDSYYHIMKTARITDVLFGE
ncbi:MAG: serine protease [Bacteroidales bacterium]|nr:serine protease [Bacteroidales bacterium]